MYTSCQKREANDCAHFPLINWTQRDRKKYYFFVRLCTCVCLCAIFRFVSFLLLVIFGIDRVLLRCRRRCCYYCFTKKWSNCIVWCSTILKIRIVATNWKLFPILCVLCTSVPIHHYQFQNLLNWTIESHIDNATLYKQLKINANEQKAWESGSKWERKSWNCKEN